MSEALDQTFLQQVNRHLGIAHKVARAYFQAQDEREDAIQEMMYQLWRSFSGFDGHSKFSTWMYRVCLNTALTLVKRLKRDGRVSLSMRHLEIPEATQEDENITLLFRAIATLAPLNKAIILLYLEDMSYDEIAGITGMTRANVSVRLVRIKNELETKLKGTLYA